MEEVKAVLAANLRRLMDYAADHKTGEPASQRALSRVADVGRATVHRALRSDDAAVGIDTLESIARAHGLQAWQLLTPSLDPSNPPELLSTESERPPLRSANAELLAARIRTLSPSARRDVEGFLVVVTTAQKSSAKPGHSTE